MFVFSKAFIKYTSFILVSVSPNQIRRLYCRFSSLDKATKGTLRFVDAAKKCQL